jgi:DNA-binding protein H-NS
LRFLGIIFSSISFLGVFNMQKELRALLKKLDLDGLAEVQGLIDTQLKEKAKEAKKALRAEIKEFEKKANRYGLTLEQVTGLKKVARSTASGAYKPKGEPKYRNSANADQTWTGKGRKPTWLDDALKAGKKLEDFAM